MPLGQRESLCKRLRSVGLSRSLTYQLLDQMHKWVRCSGEEWAVKRVKSMKVDYLRFLSGLPPVGQWYAKNALGRPKGPFGLLWGLEPKVAIAALGVYSVLWSSTVTKSQWNKFHGSATRPVSYHLTVEVESVLRSTANRLLPKTPRVVQRLPGETWETQARSAERRAPYGVLDFGTTPEREVGSTLQWADTSVGRRLYQSFRCLRSIHEGPSLKVVSGFQSTRRQPVPGVVGSIGFIQESGCKLRAVANPVRHIQVALKPLERFLKTRILSQIPTDCTLDQSKGPKWVQERLRSGHRIWSVDLSDATNNFPLDLQLPVLREVSQGTEYAELVELFAAVSRLPWRVRPPKGKPTTMQWTVGQPLGLAPSFASFAIAHHMLVWQCWQNIGGLGLRKLEDASIIPYRILGDDIVISHEGLYREYRSALQYYGVPVSEDKTLPGAPLGEFAGKVITKDQILAQPKFKRMSDDSFVEVVRQFGPISTGLLRRRQKAVLEWLAPLPESLGGLGWNPKGLPLEDRIQNAWDWIYRERERNLQYVETATYSVRELHRAFYEGFLQIPWSVDPSTLQCDPHTDGSSWLAQIGVRPDRVTVEEGIRPPDGYHCDFSDVRTRQTLLSVLERYAPDVQEGNVLDVDENEQSVGPMPC